MHPDLSDLQSLVDEELEPLDRYELDQHLEACKGCRDAFMVLRTVAQSLAAIPRADAPEDLAERILAACAQAAPVPRLSCEAALAMVSEYIDRELHGLELDTLEAHLYSCEECYNALRSMQRTTELLLSTPAVPAPADLHGRISAAVERETAPVAVFAWRRTAGVVAGMAAAAAIFFAVFIPRGTDPGFTPEPQIVAVQIEDTTQEAATPPADEVMPSPAVEEEVVEAVAATPPVDRQTTPRTPRVHPTSRTPEAPASGSAPASSAHSEPATPRAPQVASPRPVSPAAEAEIAREAPTTSATASAQPSEPEAASDTPAAPRESAIVRTPQPEPSAQAEPVVAALPRGPEAPSTTVAEREAVRIAVVPVQTGGRTLYRASEEPPVERIARAARAVNSDVGRHWNEADTGINLR